MYSWVKHAFGQRWGFIAVWLQWVENVPFFPAILSFVAATCAYLISPALASNKLFLLSFVLFVFWALTLVNIFGIRLSAKFSGICTAIGLLIPMVLLISMGGIWYLTGHPLAVHLTSANMIPHFNHLSVWVTMQGVLLSLCGIELATVHAKDTINPQRSFPLALLISVVVIIITLVMGSLSIAWVIPVEKLSLVSGIMEAFNHFLNAYHAHWVLPILGVMIAIGSIGGVNSGIIAPTRGLRIACEDENLPKKLTAHNRHGTPATLLLLQAVLVSLIISAFFLIPSVNGAYWLLSVLAAQIYMLMYIIMFLASLTLKWKDKQTPTHYKIPGGRLGHMIIGTLGLIGASVAFLICFIPPSNLHIGKLSHYEIMLVAGLLTLVLLPLLLRIKKRR